MQTHRSVPDLLEQLGVSAVRIDTQGTILAVSRAWRQFAAENGALPGSVEPGTNYLAACDAAAGDRAEQAAAAACGIRAVLAGTMPDFSLDYPCHAPHVKRWYKLLVSRVEGPAGALVLHVDITPEKLAELEVDQRRREAERAIAIRDRFLAIVSHDLRQPLQAAELFLDVLGRQVDTPKGLQMASHLGASLAALRHLLDSLSDMSRLELGKEPVLPCRLRLGEVLAQVAEEARVQATAKGLELHWVDCGVEVVTDPQLLARLLRNLLSNAVRYTDRGRVLLGARRRPGGRVELLVADTGIGIAPELQEVVFSEFYQVAPTDGEGRNGLGLGLSIVRGLAALLGAELRLSSRPGQGTRVHVRLPPCPPGPAPAGTGQGGGT